MNGTRSSTPAAAPGVPLVGGARLPLAFIGFGLAAFATASGLLAANPQQLSWPHVHPQLAALAHLWLPGFLLSVCCGALYQLMPVVLGAPLRLPLAAAWTHLGLHAAGVGSIALGFHAARFEIVAGGGILVSAGVGILLVAAWRTFRASARRDAIGWSMPLAVSWLAATVLAGVLLALNRRGPFLPLSILDLLAAHAHLGLAGFFLTLLQGATFQLVPMFTMAELRGARWVRAGLVLTPAGLAALTVGLAAGGRGPAIAGAVLLSAAIGCSGVALVATLRSRRRKKLEPGLQAFRLGAALVLPVALGGWVLLAASPDAAWTSSARMTYALVTVAGALSFMVLGMLCKIVPFLVWMRAYGPHAGRRPVPLATALGSQAIECTWLALHLAALLALGAGILGGAPAWLCAGAWLLAAAAGAFLLNMARVLGHLFHPETAPAHAPAPRLVRP